jgi:hypothetical protein
MEGYWASRAPSTAVIRVLDIDSDVVSGEEFVGLKQGFSAAKSAIRLSAIAQGAQDGGESAVLEAYHGTLVAPFCIAAARSFFGAQ